MTKYHINQETGRPNICRATVKDCPVGGEHFNSKEEARAGFEAQQSGSFGVPMKKEKSKGGDPVSVLRDRIAEREAKSESLRLEKETASPSRKKKINGELRGIGIHIAREKRELSNLEKNLEKVLVPTGVSKTVRANEIDVTNMSDDEFYSLEPSVEDLEEIELEDDFKDLFCSECGELKEDCICATCSCGAFDDEEHEDYCELYASSEEDHGFLSW